MTLMFTGDEFSPQKFLESTQRPLTVVDKIEPSDTNDAFNEPYGFGSLDARNPKGIGITHYHNLDKYQLWYVKFLEEEYEELHRRGVDDIQLFTDIFYCRQCNFYMLNPDILSRIGRYKVSLPFSVYSLTPKQIKHILKDEGYSKKKIKRIFKLQGE